MASTLH
jgi:hypothetical protein